MDSGSEVLLFYGGPKSAVTVQYPIPIHVRVRTSRRRYIFGFETIDLRSNHQTRTPFEVWSHPPPPRTDTHISGHCESADRVSDGALPRKRHHGLCPVAPYSALLPRTLSGPAYLKFLRRPSKQMYHMHHTVADPDFAHIAPP